MHTQNSTLQEDRLLKIVLLYLPVVIISMFLHDKIVDTPALLARIELHEKIISGNGPAPIQYRIFIHYLAELLLRLGVTFKTAYLFWRAFFTLTSAVFLHYFLKKLKCETKVCIIGTLLFLAVLPFTYLHYYMQPTDLPNLAFFLLGYILIEQRRDGWFALLLFVSMLNRETPVLLPLVWLFYRYDELKFKRLVTRFLLFIVTLLSTYLLLRKIFGIRPNYALTSYIILNSTHIKPYLYALIFFGYPLVSVIYRWKDMQKPKFLRRAVLFIPFFIILYWTMGIMEESRLWLPLLPLVVALGMISLFGTKEEVQQEDSSMNFSPVLVKYRHFFYGGMLGLFILGLLVYNNYYNRIYIKSRDKTHLAYLYLDEAYHYLYRLKHVKYAESIYLRAKDLKPDDPEINYQLGVLYFHYLPDREKAFTYLSRFMENGTDEIRLSEAKKMLAQLK